DRADALGQRLRNLLRVARGPNAGAINAPSTAVQKHAVNYYVQVLLPLVHHVVTKHDLGESWAVHLNARVAPIAFDRGGAAENHRAVRSANDFGAHIAAARINRDRFFRHTGFGKRGGHSIGSPRFLWAWLEQQPDLHRDHRQP